MRRLPTLCLLLLSCGHAAAAAPAAPPAYDSAFASYKKYAEPQVADWKQTNADIAAAPGHGAHAGHAMSKPAGEHAGHGGQSAGKPDEHAGHRMTAPAPSPVADAARQTKPSPKPDPHAEHQH